MNPFNYSLAELKKVSVSLVFAIAYVAAFLIFGNGADNLSFANVCVACVGPLFAVIGVFGAKNLDPDALDKSLQQLVGAVITVVGYFTTVPSSTTQQVILVVGALASAFVVFHTHNAGQNA